MEENIMFSKKSLPISIALILLIALSTLGLAYGAWTDTLNINGTVQTGTFEVQFTNLWWSDTNCSYVMDSTNHTLTITANNAYPGFWCEVSVEVKNTGSIPVKILPVAVTTSGPDYWDVYPYYTSATTLQPGQTGAGTAINFTIPMTETGNEGTTSTVTVTIQAEQAQ
jgi:hypothetical protein